MRLYSNDYLAHIGWLKLCMDTSHELHIMTVQQKRSKQPLQICTTPSSLQCRHHAAHVLVKLEHGVLQLLPGHVGSHSFDQAPIR